MTDLERVTTLLREYRVVLVELAIAVATMTGPPFWFPLLFGGEAGSGVGMSVMPCLAASFAVLIFCTAWVRRRAILQARCDAALHRLARYLRTETQDSSRVVIRVTDKVNYSACCNEICNLVADVFRARTAKPDVGCCLRLADSHGRSEYVTKGRSSSLNPGRGEGSCPVTTASGIYRKLSSQTTSDAIVFIKSMDEALSQGDITMDANIEKYRHEIESMMVARLNVSKSSASSGMEETLWGILYVTHPRKGFFPGGLEPLMKAIADMVAKALWDIVLIKDSEGAKNNDEAENAKCKPKKAPGKSGKARGKSPSRPGRKRGR